MTRTWNEYDSYGERVGEGSLSETLAKSVLEELERTGAYVEFYGAAENQFKLSIGAFEVIKDPQDGYRSSLGTVLISESDGTIFFQTPIARVRLVKNTANDPEDKFQVNDTHSLVDEDGHVWLTYGTNNTDDYYPYFVFRYEPKGEQQ